MPKRTAVVASLASFLIAVAPAVAGTPGKWTPLGQANIGNIDEASLARTADGTLHVVWRIPGSNNDTLVHDAVGPNGVVAPPNVIQTGWASIDPVADVLADASGLRVFFGGIRSTSPTETNSNMNTATAPASGAAWSLQPGTVVTGDAAYGSDVGAAELPDGTPLIAFGGTGTGVFTHRGLDPATPNFPLQDQLGGCCGYSPDVAVDAKTGAPFAAWISNATGKVGVFAQSLDAGTGAPNGPVMKMPGSSTLFQGREESNQQLQRIPIAARATGGIYVAYPGGYPTTKKVLLWRMGSPTAAVVGTSNNDHIASLAADPAGRLWVVWVQRSSPPQVFARRSNLAATKFGPATRLKAPKGFDSAYKITGNAQAGTLDIVGLFGSTSGQGQFHTQVLPPLEIAASPTHISRSKATNVKFTVRDPDPVKGAKLTGGGDAAVTNAKGQATLTLGPARSVTVTARKIGYRFATEKLKGK